MAAANPTELWHLDSAVGEHWSTDRDIIFDLQVLDTPAPVMYANGETSTATQVGKVMLKHKHTNDLLTFERVLHTPGKEKVNILSLGRLADKGATASFDATMGTLTTPSGYEIFAPKLGNVYVLSDWEPLRAADAEAESFMFALKLKTPPKVWHQRLGHLGKGNMLRLLSEDLVNGIDLTPKDLEVLDEVCDPCRKGRMVRSPFPSSSTKVEGTLDLIHMDLCGPMEESRGGSKYFATFKDDYSGMSWIKLTRTKEKLAEVIKQQLALLENQTGLKVKAVLTDRGREYVNTELDTYLANKGILHNATMPYTPQQNGEAERLNRTLQEKVRPMLSQSGLQLDMWGEAIMVANYLRTVSPVAGKPKTPWELYYGTKPNLSHLRSFGCRAYTLIPKQMRQHKMAEVAEPGIMVGYAINGKGYRILMDDGTIKNSRDVTFDEETFPGEEEDIPGLLSADDSEEEEEQEDSAPEEDEPPPAPHSGSAGSESPPPSPPADHNPPSSPIAPGAPARPQRERRPNVRLQPIGLVKFHEPQTYEEAISGEQGEKWQVATDEEMASLLENNTWEVVDKPPGANIIDVKWVYKVKYDTTGKVDRFKARLVAKGYKQLEGIDYNEVFAPVTKYSTIRSLLAVAAAEDWELQLLDIKTAFLNGVLEEEVYINHPPGYPQGPPGTVLKLNKTLYGLKQAPRAWHQRLDSELLNLGFTSSASDPGLYIQTEENNRIFLMVYVDDILIASDNLDLIEAIKGKLMTAFDARDMGDAGAYLGMKIARDRGSRTIKLSQGLMIKNMIDKYGLEDGKTRTVPIGLNIKLAAEEGEPLDTSKYPYSQLVGSMMYLAVCTRPDISYSVGALARYMAKPTLVHWQAAKGVLRYLGGTPDYGITFGPNKLDFAGYCDADFAGDVDTRKSTSGYVFTLGGGAISWSSKKQATVAASTTEAEYMSAAYAVKEALWLGNLLSDIGLDIFPVKIFGDNQSALKLLRNPISSLRSKHIDVAYHFARDRVMRGDIIFSYVKTEDMLADMMTKAVPTVKHVYCCKGIGIGPV
jgi:transposase InsO family protein